MPTVFQSPSELKDSVGKHLGYSDWLTIEQSRIDQFADATLDHQWIHIDAERAKAGPFGATIAHGYLTSSLVSHFLPQIITVGGISMGINYGADRLRFPRRCAWARSYAPGPNSSKRRIRKTAPCRRRSALPSRSRAATSRLVSSTR